MRRWVAKTLTLALAASGLQAVWVADPAWACGCGAMIPGSGGTMSVAREQAVVRFDGTTENVVMRFSTQSNVTDAAWVMPVPAQATAKLGDQALFSDLTDAEEPVASVHHYFWPHIGGSSGNTGSVRAARWPLRRRRLCRCSATSGSASSRSRTWPRPTPRRSATG